MCDNMTYDMYEVMYMYVYMSCHVSCMPYLP